MAGVYGTGFTSESLARVRARGLTKGPGIMVSSDKGLTDVGMIAEGD